MSSDAALVTQLAAAALSGNESAELPGAIVNVCVAMIAPIMSGAHGGVVPSAALQRD